MTETPDTARAPQDGLGRTAPSTATTAASEAPANTPAVTDLSRLFRGSVRALAIVGFVLALLGGTLSGEQYPFLQPLCRAGFFCLFLASCVMVLRLLLLRMQPQRVRGYAAREAARASRLAHPAWRMYALAWCLALMGSFTLLIALAPTWIFRWSPATSPSAYIISVLGITIGAGLVTAGPLVLVSRLDRIA